MPFPPRDSSGRRNRSQDGSPAGGGVRAAVSNWRSAVGVTAAFVVLLWAVEIFDQVTPVHLDDDGVRPRSLSGLDGIAWMPLLHGGYDHLVSNTMLTIPLLFLTLLGSLRRGLLATAVIWGVAGCGTWLVAGTGTSHIGASGLVFGWLTFLILRGVYTRSPLQIVIGIALLASYGSMLIGVLPGQPGISWEGHLFGACGGVLAARLLRPRPAPH